MQQSETSCVMVSTTKTGNGTRSRTSAFGATEEAEYRREADMLLVRIMTYIAVVAAVAILVAGIRGGGRGP